MRCPFCNSDQDKVIDSRGADNNRSIRRRRECEECGRRYTTYERVEEVPFFVIKKDYAREQYDRAKVLSGIQKACEKRPVSLESQEQIVEGLERMFHDRGEREIPSTVIGEFLMQQLAKVDQVAYVRFASVYREFQDVGHFMKELKAMITK